MSKNTFIKNTIELYKILLIPLIFLKKNSKNICLQKNTHKIFKVVLKKKNQFFFLPSIYGHLINYL